jgi:hypothetical protein
MAKGNTTWKVLPHSPIEKLSENLWRVEGDLPNMPLKRVMAIAKRADGDLVIHNGVALSPSAMAEIDAFGKVRYIIVPNGFHRMDARVYKDRYPEARVLCPRGCKKKVEEVVPVDGAYEDFPADAAVSLETLEGVGEQEGVMIVKSQDGASLVFNDALFNMPHVPGAHGFVLRYITASSGGLKVSRIARLFIVKDRAAYRTQLERLAETPSLRRILVAHHETVKEGAAEALRAVAASL